MSNYKGYKMENVERSDDAIDPTISNEEVVEVAAPRKLRGDKQYGSPLAFVREGFHSIVMNAHPLFRLLIMGALLNNKTFETFESTNIAGVMGYDFSGFTANVTAARIREIMEVSPGNGNSKPIRVSFTEQLTNLPDELVNKFFDTLTKEQTKGLPLSKMFDVIEGIGISPSVQSALAPSFETFKERFLDQLDDFVDFTMAFKRESFNEATKTSNINFVFHIDIDGSAYPELVQSDDFSPYLVYLWVNNSLKSNRVVDKIFDPRLVSVHQRAILKFGDIRPKVNKDGFAIWGNGAPIYIPPQLDLTEQFVKKADTCVDENGNFQRSMIAEEYQLANKIIYVDWVNDVMAYTTATGILETINLGNVAPLDPASEYSFLSTPVKSQEIVDIMKALTNSLAEMDDAEEAVKYTTNEEVKKLLRDVPPVKLYTDIVSPSVAGVTDVTLMHLAGGQLSDLEDYPHVANVCRAIKCLFIHLNRKRAKDPTALKIPSNFQSQGILYRLIGLEYVLQAMEKYDDKKIETIRKEWAIDRENSKVDRTQHSFDIPNIKVGKGGLTGLLPHQGRILTSGIKTPRQMILPVQTGGGKTILTTIIAIFGAKNLKSIPMILTKGNLIKGTITEINGISGGKINAIPLTPVVLRRMARRGGIKTFKQFLAWYKSLPPNTIFVSSYTAFASRKRIYEDLSTVPGFGDNHVFTTQFLMIIKILGIRMIIGDESHMIKNPASARSRNSYAIFSHADSRGIASGTIVSNTVNDLVGQTRAISPAIFGDDPERFADMYGVTKGIIKSDKDATVIKDRLRATTAYHEATREDWSYMLPIKFDEILFARMTEKQTEFYNILMQEAYLMLAAADKSKKKVKAEDDEEEDDEEEDDEDEDDEEGDAEENALIAKAKVHLQKVEAFLVAPDENEQYMAWEKKPDGADLVSPKVRLAEEILDAHFALNKNDLKNNKVIVFGWNKVASKHFVRHSKYGSKFLHYTAGDEEVVRQYEKDDTVVGMVADENSLREGFNLQMTSLILRQQSVWSPGDHEQAVARMYRPDPRGKYNRETVRHVWLMNETYNGDVTLDGVKMARLASKFVSNARLTYEGRHEWKRVSHEFDELKMLKMNLAVIFDTRKDDLLSYFGAWKTFVDWENDINVAAKRRLAQQLEAQYNVTLINDKQQIIDINQFVELAMSEITSTSDIPGSRRVFTPLVPNAIPADPKGWGFAVMGSQDVPVGTVVYTEYGPAVITAVLTRGVKCRIFDGRIIGFKRGDILLVSPNKYKQFSAIVKDPTKWREEAFHPMGVKNVKRAKEEELEDDEEVIEGLEDEEDIEEDEDDLIDVDVMAGIVNGWPSLIIDEDIDELKGLDGWNRVDAFTSVGFRSWAAAEKFIEILDDKAYIPPKVHERLLEEMEQIREGKQMKLGKQINMGDFRNFFIAQRKKLGRSKDKRVVVNPYWIVNELDVKMAFDTDSHESAFISWLRKVKDKIPGVTKVNNNDPFWINIFNSTAEAIRDIENLKKIAEIDERSLKDDLADIKKDVMALRKPRSRPKM